MKYLDISGLCFQLANTKEQQKFSALYKCQFLLLTLEE